MIDTDTLTTIADTQKALKATRAKIRKAKIDSPEWDALITQKVLLDMHLMHLRWG